MAAEKYTREELAGIEVGQTTISLQSARVLTTLFLMLIFLVPLVQELAGITNKKVSGISVFWISLEVLVSSLMSQHL